MRRIVFCVTLALCASCGSDAPPAPNGEACEVDEDCQGEVCLENLDTIIFPEGMCAQECSSTPPTGCADEEICLVHYGEVETTLCYQRCIYHSDCREGYQCQGGFFWQACLPSPE